MKKNNTRTYRDIIAALLTVLSFIAISVCDGFAAAGNVRNECLRLHILAASDSEADQNVKLLVRDRLLETGADIFSASTDSREAAEKIEKNKDVLIAAANAVLEENGCSYTADIIIEEEYFETREYGDIRLPAGVYKACKVILGDGEGHNWWCVMFPPLCLPAAVKRDGDELYAVFSEEGTDLITGKSGYKIKFKIVEVFQEIAKAVEERKAENKE